MSFFHQMTIAAASVKQPIIPCNKFWQ